jgi:hypothetical protein
MHRVGLLGIMLIVWAVLTGVWILLLIYRSVRVSEESEQLFLGQGKESLAKQQEETIHKEERVGAFLYAFGIASIVMLVSTLGVWIWRGLGA